MRHGRLLQTSAAFVPDRVFPRVRRRNDFRISPGSRSDAPEESEDAGCVFLAGSLRRDHRRFARANLSPGLELSMEVRDACGIPVSPYNHTDDVVGPLWDWISDRE